MRGFRRISVLFGVLIVALGLSAQTHYRPRLSIGGRAGISMGKITFSPSVKEQWTYGTTGAVTFRYCEEKLFALVGEVGWVQRGWAEDFEESSLRYRRELTYVQIPLLAQIYFGSRRFKTFINLGPQIAFLVGERIDSNFDYRNAFDDPAFPSRNRKIEQMSMAIHDRFDYGISGSLGFEFFVRPRHSILLEGRYYFGLGNIFSATKADVFGASRNMSIEVTLGYQFRIQ